jgi:adenylosuccinate synthase
LGFGDSGKGSIVDALVRKYQSKLVIRYCGGAQASHAVTTEDGRVHKFSQWGAGTLAGAMTYLHYPMIIDPLAMRNEAESLKSNFGFGDPWRLLTIHPDCLIATRVHKYVNRQSAETIQNGSCGMGIGATREYWLKYGSDAIVASDLVSNSSQLVWYDRLIGKLELMIARYELQHKFSAVLEARALLDIATLHLAWRVLPLEFKQPKSDEVVIFEGSQGLLLDQHYGCSPHTTWSDVTARSALELIHRNDVIFTSVRQLGIIRAYMTRHGAGPLPTAMSPEELSVMGLSDPYNPHNEYQGRMRFGWPDVALLEYALDSAQGIDSLAVNCVDQVDGKSLHVRMRADECHRWTDSVYRSPGEWTALPWVEIADTIDSICPISVIGRGPKASDKIFLKDSF